MRRSTAYILVAAAALWLTGCGQGPSDAELRARLLAGLAGSVPRDVVAIENVRAIDTGDRRNDRYTALVSYTLRFLRGLPEVREAPEISRTEAIRLLLRYGDFRAGDQLEQTRRVTLQRSGERWVMASR